MGYKNGVQTWQLLAKDATPQIRTSVNFISQAISASKFTRIIFDKQAEANLDPKWLTVEITETAAEQC